jgi:uracil-DNA glycosylase
MNATHVCIPSSGATNKYHCLVVGEAPGRNEDEQNAPFVGRSGWLLDRELNRALGVDNARHLIPVTNAVKCRPTTGEGKFNLTPQYPDINTCVDAYLTHEIFLLDARVILALGNVAAQALLDVTGISMLRESWHSLGTTIERWVRVTYHPAYVLRLGLDSEIAQQFREDVKEFTIKAMEA